jgi:expansin
MGAVVCGGSFAVACGFGPGCAHELTAVEEPVIPPVLRCSDAPIVHTGRATYYTFADGGGNCSFDPTPNDLLVAAMNAADYAGAMVCGMTVRVTGPKGQVNVRIVDRCPGCAQGDLDLSPQAFAAIGDLPAGSVPITWVMIPSVVSGPILYHFNAQSNEWWTAVQLRNYRYPIRSLEYLGPGGKFISVARTDYNYFVATSGMGKGPFTFRVTDLFGRTLIDSAIIHAPNMDVPGNNQFPLCTP